MQGKDGDEKEAAGAGSQTLARGLRALQLIAASPEPLSVQQVATQLGVHRTIAYRLLNTLVQFHLVARAEDGGYHPAAGLAALGASFERNLRGICLPILRNLADDLRLTVSLLVAEGEEQVAVAVIVPRNVSYQLSFHEGSRYPLDRGAAGLALLAAMPPRPGEREEVKLARNRGWVLTYGEIEPNTYGLAVLVRHSQALPPMCINLISHRKDVVEGGLAAALVAAERLAALFD